MIQIGNNLKLKEKLRVSLELNLSETSPSVRTCKEKETYRRINLYSGGSPYLIDVINTHNKPLHLHYTKDYLIN